MKCHKNECGSATKVKSTGSMIDMNPDPVLLYPTTIELYFKKDGGNKYPIVLKKFEKRADQKACFEVFLEN
jgi:hypothetical protein